VSVVPIRTPCSFRSANCLTLLCVSLGTIPGPLLMGVAFDNTCLLWQPLPCSDESGSCVFYDNNALSKNFLVLMCSVKVISFVAMILAVILYQPPHVVTDQSVVMEVKSNSVDVSSSTINDEKLTKSLPESNLRLTNTDAEYLGTRRNDFESVQL
jgi:Organic Anion Transporter Polypeptide (OATP) family